MGDEAALQGPAFEVLEEGPVADAVAEQNVDELWNEGLPESPEEYLVRVRREALEYQSGEVAVAVGSEDDSAKQMPSYVSRMAQIVSCGAHTTPLVGKCWQEDLLRYFKATREWAHAQLSASTNTRTAAVTESDISTREPKIEDFASQEYVWTVIQALSEKTSNEQTAYSGEDYGGANADAAVVPGMFSDRDLLWAFAALTMLDDLAAYDADVAFALQTIRRQCCTQTAALESDSDMRGVLVTIVTVISCYFGQK